MKSSLSSDEIQGQARMKSTPSNYRPATDARENAKANAQGSTVADATASTVAEAERLDENADLGFFKAKTRRKTKSRAARRRRAALLLLPLREKRKLRVV